MRWQDIDSKSHFWPIPGAFVKNAHGPSCVLERDRAKILQTVPGSDNAVRVFPKSFMGGRRARARTSSRSRRRAGRSATGLTSVATICAARPRV